MEELNIVDSKFCVNFFMWIVDKKRSHQMEPVGYEHVNIKDIIEGDVNIQDPNTIGSLIGYSLWKYLPILLPAALKQCNIQKFVPYRKPSFDFNGGCLEIVFYHDEDLYKFMYESMPGMVMTPQGGEEMRLQQLYETYAHDYYDRVWYADYDPDEDESEDSDNE